MRINFNDSPWVDVNYINLLSRDVERFQWKNSSLANCRCFICGDSEKNKSLTRGYFLGKSKGWRYYCHNCGANHSLYQLLEIYFESLHREYIKDKIAESTNGISKEEIKTRIEKNTKTVKAEPKRTKILTAKDHEPIIESCSQLNADHPAFRFLEKRKIPYQYFSRIRYTDNFARLFLINPDALEDPRVFLTVKNLQKEVIGFIGRYVDGFSKVRGNLRYMNHFIKEDESAFYNIERIDGEKRVYGLEGAFDSMFLPNAIAINSSDLTRYHEKKFGHKDSVLVFDNEPRNKFVLEKLNKAILQNRNVCIWSEKFTSHKDINKMVENGIRPELIQEFIDSNTFQGLEARIRFQQYVKI